MYSNCTRPANIFDIFLPEKWRKQTLLVYGSVFLMVERDPPWVVTIATKQL